MRQIATLSSSSTAQPPAAITHFFNSLLKGVNTRSHELSTSSGDLPKVSLVSIFHQRVDFVSLSVASMLSQDYPNLEIVIYDDGSRDGTAEALASFSDPRLRVVTQKNAGFTKTLNRAIRDSTGEIIMLHGSGDVTEPDRVSKQVAPFLVHNNVGAVGCRVNNSESTTGPAVKPVSPFMGHIHPRVLAKNMPFTHGAGAFRRTVFDQIDGYREFFNFAQDRDFYLRMPHDLIFVVIPEFLYYWRKPPESVNSNVKKVIRQALLIELAVQCALECDNGRADLVDLYGESAVGRLAPSPVVGSTLR